MVFFIVYLVVCPILFKKWKLNTDTDLLIYGKEHEQEEH